MIENLLVVADVVPKKKVRNDKLKTEIIYFEENTIHSMFSRQSFYLLF